jgi:hypothetical protein
MLTIVPKNNHDKSTYWYFDVKDHELAEQVLKDFFPDGTHEIIETDCEEWESAAEFERWTFEHHGYQ